MESQSNKKYNAQNSIFCSVELFTKVLAKYRLTAKFAQVITLPKNKIIVSGKQRKSLLIALIAELCFIAFSLVFGFWGHYKSLGIEISVHVMLIVVSFLTVFLSLTWYKTKSIFFRFLHLLFVSLCLALLGTLLFLLLHEVFSHGFQHIGGGFWNFLFLWFGTPYGFALWAGIAVVPCFIAACLLRKWES